MTYNRWRFPHFYKGRFANYPGEKSNKTFFRMLFALARMVLQHKDRAAEKELESWIMPQNSLVESNPQEPSITWIGHSTFLIKIAGKTLLTDPIFDTLSYIVRFRRLTPPGIPLQSLPRVDAVLISHNHPDHMDEESIALLKQHSDPLFLVPIGDKPWFEKRGHHKVEEFTWWDTISISDDVRCTFLPAVHWSQRGLFDRNKSLWGGWMIESTGEFGQTIYFAGDTAYSNHFKAIGERYPSIDVSLMPIGAYEPRELTRCSHIDPDEAGQAFLDLNSNCFIPMHWGTYHLGLEKPLDPIRKIRAWWGRYAPDLKNKRLECLKIGQKFVLASSSLAYTRKPVLRLGHEL